MPDTVIAGAFAGLLVTATAALEDSVGVALHGEHWLLLLVVGADGQFWEFRRGCSMRDRPGLSALSAMLISRLCAVVAVGQ